MIELTIDAIETTTDETIPPDASVAEAADYLRDPAIGALPVLEGESLVGMITASDIVALVSETDDRPTVRSIMSTPVSTVRPTTTLRDAADVMRTEGVKHLLVVEDGVYHGLLSVDALAPYLSRHNLEIDWADEPLRVNADERNGLTASD